MRYDYQRFAKDLAHKRYTKRLVIVLFNSIISWASGLEDVQGQNVWTKESGLLS